MAKKTATPVKTAVPVSDPAHPSHSSWLEILLAITKAATAIGPVVVGIVSPGNADLANKLGAVATIAENQIPSQK